LYERGTAPALVALVTFGLRTTPYQKPSQLLAAVRAKLNSHKDLWEELQRYREALEPNAVCAEQRTVKAMYTAQEEAPHTDSKARTKSETMMMREFMSFVVTRLQVKTKRIIGRCLSFVPLLCAFDVFVTRCGRRCTACARRMRCRWSPSSSDSSRRACTSGGPTPIDFCRGRCGKSRRVAR
jgi:hypothetical protein